MTQGNFKFEIGERVWVDYNKSFGTVTARNISWGRNKYFVNCEAKSGYKFLVWLDETGIRALADRPQPSLWSLIVQASKSRITSCGLRLSRIRRFIYRKTSLL